MTNYKVFEMGNLQKLFFFIFAFSTVSVKNASLNCQYVVIMGLMLLASTAQPVVSQ